MFEEEEYQQLENQWSDYIGTDYAVSCSSGTAGLTLALLALNLTEGDEVIVPDFGMIATPWAVSWNKLKPVFVDCGNDMNIDVDKIEQAITARTKAIMVTHIYGRPADMPSILHIADNYNLKVIEDACEAHGATIEGQRVGSFGDAGVFSLYRNKIIQCEEGGLVNTNDANLKFIMDDLKSMSFGEEHDYIHRKMGFNFRLTNMQAQVAMEELSRINEHLEHREKLRQVYDHYLEVLTIPRPEGSVIWVYDILLKDKEQRDKLHNLLLDNFIQPRLFFKPNTLSAPYFQKPNERALWFSERGLYLPVTNTMSEDEAEKIAKLIVANI